MAHDELYELPGRAHQALRQAIDFSFSCQQDDGHWVAPVSADATFTAQYVMLRHSIPGLNMDSNGAEAAAYRRWFLAEQNKSEGSWSTGAVGQPGNLSTTVEAYLALRLLGTPASDPALLKARDFVIAHGGVARVRFFTRFFLATFGLFPWSAIPQMPPELILMPNWSPLNIYVLCSWARVTLLPILVVRHHEPVHALPNGRCDPNNDYLDELWVDPTNKEVPFAPPLWDLCCGGGCDVVKLGFTLGDKLLAQLGGLRKGPQRRLALRRCIDWLLEHQDESGDWAGIFPAMHGAVSALSLEGFPLHHDAVRRGLAALDRLVVIDDSGRWIQSTTSPCWDTALMVKALCEAGLGLGGNGMRNGERDARVAAAVDWIRARQLLGPQGDWRVYSRNRQSGGWSFQYQNVWYPDSDDTAVVIMMFVQHDPAAFESDTVERGVEWILGMQNRDGGWAGFDTNNHARWLHKIPFNDMELVDPSTADVTGRVLECFGMLLSHRNGGRHLRRDLARRLRESAKKALAFLFKDQTLAGAWWGRWGVNYIYGTANVLRGLPTFCGNKEVARVALRAVLWLEACQNADGGWGETVLSYEDTSLAGQGPSTAAQTAWALDALLRFRPASHPALQRGVRWLLINQNPKSEERRHLSSWPSNNLYMGTGFPRLLYIGYPFYHHHSAISALARFIGSSRVGNSSHGHGPNSRLPPQLVSSLSRQDILLMVSGGQSDIGVLLSIAERLGRTGHRVRIATHSAHRELVYEQRLEFHDVGDCPCEFAQGFGRGLGWLWSMIRGDVGRLRKTLFSLSVQFWQAGFDADNPNKSGNDSVGCKGQEVVGYRPFMAGLVVSVPGTTVDIHTAESLGCPLVLVTAHGTLPTRDVLPMLAINGTRIPGRWWSYATGFISELLDWLAVGTLINGIRVKTYRMNPVCWARSSLNCNFGVTVPQVCLWSSHMVLPAAERHGRVVVPGSTALPHEKQLTPPVSLPMSIETDIDRPGRYRGRCAEVAERSQADDDGIDIAATVIEDELEAAKAKAGPCVLDPTLQAQWLHVESGLKLSGIVAASLVASDMLCWEDLKMVARVDWAGWQDGTRRSCLCAFCAVTSWLGIIVFRILLTILGWLPRSGHKYFGNDVGIRDGTDPVRSAAIRRSTFDLHLHQRKLDEQKRTAFGEAVGCKWQAVTAAEFHGRFRASS